MLSEDMKTKIKERISKIPSDKLEERKSKIEKQLSILPEKQQECSL